MQSRTRPVSFDARAAGRGLALRPVNGGDAAFLTELFASVRAADFAPLGWPEPVLRQLLAQQAQFQHLQYETAYPEAERLIVERDSVPVGRIYVDEGEAAIRLIDISLIQDERGKGSGTALVRDLLDRAAAAGKPVILSVVQGNPARRLYERLDFDACADGGAYEEMRWAPPGAFPCRDPGAP